MPELSLFHCSICNLNLGRFKLCLVLLVIQLNVQAQSFTPNPGWRFENFNSQNHFINSEILDLAIDKFGYVWTCSRGIQRFDGYKTIEFNSFDKAEGAIRTNYTDIIADNNGRIWVNSAGLCYYDNKSGKFNYIQSDKKHPITYVNTFLIRGSDLWFICNYGLAKLDVNTLRISFTSLTNVINPLGVFRLDGNTLLISSREKIYRYNISKDSFAVNTLIYKGALLKIFNVAQNNTDIFLGTNRGLFTMKSLYEVSPVCNETRDIEINDLLFLPQDKRRKFLLIAIDGRGLALYNTTSKKVEATYIHDDNNPYSLPSNIVSKFYIDNAKRIWMSTGLGISMLDAANQQWEIRFINKNNTDDPMINRIARDKFDTAKVWMSSHNRGMIWMNWKTKKIEKIFDTHLQNQQLNDFVQVSKNKWLLVTQKKIIEWSPQAGILSQKNLPVPDSLLLVYYIHKIIMADNACFITTNRGLYKYDLHTGEITEAAVNSRSKRAEDLEYDLVNGFYDDGLLWAASRNGLFSYNPLTQVTHIYKGNRESADYYLFDIAKTKNNQIICASGDGISIFNKQTHSFNMINTIASLYEPDCESVLSINNTVWINSEAGILTYDLATRQSARAEFETPLTQIFPGSPLAVIGHDIALGFRNGFAYFTPGLKNVSAPTEPIIEKVTVNNRTVLQQYVSGQSIPALRFDNTDNSINITFTSFLYTDPGHIKFRYRLKGTGAGWQYAEDQRSANYAQLPPGDYSFFVQSGNKNGIWNSRPTVFSFTISPPYWATWWFRLFAGLVIVSALYLLYRYRVNHLLAIERIREKIASDFHDDIGSALSSISIYSEVADKQLQQHFPPEKTREIVSHISFQSRTMLDALDDIIWAVNPQNDHFNDLAVRMREFTIPLLEVRDIGFVIDIPEDILSTRVKMATRKNIFMIYKECINNILKHADCTAMKVTVSRRNNQFELSISDNGKGFDTNAVHNRNGLKNIKRRAAEINGKIAITTKQGEGTAIKLLINII